MQVAVIGSALWVAFLMQFVDVAEPAKRALLVLFLLLSINFLAADGAKRLQLQRCTIQLNCACKLLVPKYLQHSS